LKIKYSATNYVTTEKNLYCKEPDATKQNKTQHHIAKENETRLTWSTHCILSTSTWLGVVVGWRGIYLSLCPLLCHSRTWIGPFQTLQRFVNTFLTEF